MSGKWVLESVHKNWPIMLNHKMLKDSSPNFYFHLQFFKAFLQYLEFNHPFWFLEI